MEMIANESIVLSGHAVTRSQQRGIPLDAVIFVASYGSVSRAKRGNMRRTMREADVNKALSRRLARPNFLEKCKNVQLITNEGGADERVVLTVVGKRNR